MAQNEQQERYLAWDACNNVRDVGGYPAGESRQTAWHKLVRSDSLHRLTSAGQAALSDYGVRTIIDLRSPHELEKDPSPFASQQGIEGMPLYLNLRVLATNSHEPTAPTLEQEYILMLEQDKQRIGSIIKAVVAHFEEGAVLVHCLGGKDRTGIIVALLLYLVGVPREIIVEDYAVSSARLEPAHREWLEEQSKLSGKPVERQKWMDSRPETIQAGLTYVDREYGGIGPYLEAAGVTLSEMEQIRKNLLAPAGVQS